MLSRAPELRATGWAMTQRVTIRTVAEASGVSVPTVSQVLNGKGWYSAETRQRVLRAAERLGYRKNALAQAVASGSFKAIALLLASEPSRSLLPPLMLEGIEAAASAREYLLTLARLPDQRLTAEGYVPRLLQQVLAEGLLVLYNAHVPPGMVEVIERNQVPAVWLNDRRDHDAVYPDDRGAGAVATRHLIELGHRRIAYIALSWERGQRPGHYSGKERLAGYRNEIKRAGLEPLEIFADRRGGLHVEERVPFLVGRLAAADRPSAVVCYNGEMAHAAMGAAIALGLRLGRDLSVVAVDAHRPSELGIELSVADLPFRQLGQVAVEMLLERIPAGRPLPARMLPVQLVAGQTTGAPAR